MARSSSELLSNLAKQPTPVKIAILAGTLAVLGFVYWQFFYSTLVDERNQLEAQRRELNAKVDKARKDADEYDELLKKKQILDAQLKKNKVTLPASSELPAFFGHLQKQAAAAGVGVKRWKRLKEKPISSYVKVPVSLTVQGTFYQINNYFRLLYQTDRIITVENLSLGNPTIRNDEIVLTARFVAATFRLKDKPPDTSLPDEAEDEKEAAKEEAEERKKAEQEGTAIGEDGLPTGAPAAPASGVNRITNPGAAGIPQ